MHLTFKITFEFFVVLQAKMQPSRAIYNRVKFNCGSNSVNALRHGPSVFVDESKSRSLFHICVANRPTARLVVSILKSRVAAYVPEEAETSVTLSRVLVLTQGS